jgi:hypothetical protein
MTVTRCTGRNTRRALAAGCEVHTIAESPHGFVFNCVGHGRRVRSPSLNEAEAWEAPRPSSCLAAALLGGGDGILRAGAHRREVGVAPVDRRLGPQVLDGREGAAQPPHPLVELDVRFLFCYLFLILILLVALRYYPIGGRRYYLWYSLATR